MFILKNKKSENNFAVTKKMSIFVQQKQRDMTQEIKAVPYRNSMDNTRHIAKLTAEEIELLKMQEIPDYIFMSIIPEKNRKDYKGKIASGMEAYEYQIKQEEAYRKLINDYGYNKHMIRDNHYEFERAVDSNDTDAVNKFFEENKSYNKETKRRLEEYYKSIESN